MVEYPYVCYPRTFTDPLGDPHTITEKYYDCGTGHERPLEEWNRLQIRADYPEFRNLRAGMRPCYP